MVPKQTPRDFAINGDYEHFIGIRQTPEEISAIHSIDWERYEENGLGSAAIAGFHLSSGGYYMLRDLYQALIPATTLMLLNGSEHLEQAVEDVCDEFGFSGEDIIWTSEFLNSDLIRGGAKDPKLPNG